MKKLLLIPVFVFFCFNLFSVQVNSLNETSKSILLCFEKGKINDIPNFFDERMKKDLPSEKLSEVWKMLNQQAGSYIKSTTITDTVYQGYRIVYITCVFQNAKLVMKTVFNSEGKVSGLFFVPEDAAKL